jgi:hypothetical protein
MFPTTAGKGRPSQLAKCLEEFLIYYFQVVNKGKKRQFPAVTQGGTAQKQNNAPPNLPRGPWGLRGLHGDMVKIGQLYIQKSTWRMEHEIEIETGKQTVINQIRARLVKQSPNFNSYSPCLFQIWENLGEMAASDQ